MSAIEPYFSSLEKRKRDATQHGFDRWPDEEDLAKYLFETNDRIDALCSALGVVVYQDVRGRWLVERAGQEEAM